MSAPTIAGCAARPNTADLLIVNSGVTVELPGQTLVVVTGSRESNTLDADLIVNALASADP